MGLVGRLSRVLQREGVSGLLRRAACTFTDRLPRPKPPFSPSTQDVQRERERYETQVTEFRSRTDGMPGWEDLAHFYWYHTIDLGGGLLTPGDYDFRHCWSSFGFPEDLTGLDVLDVGSATGFFALEFEKRGARVVSVELPSLADWDIIASERPRVIRDLMAFQSAQSPEAAYYRHIEGPFRFCTAKQRSRVQRCYSTIYELTPEKLGRPSFDLVFVGDLLLHLFSPLKALDVLAPLCHGTLVVTADAFPAVGEQPLMFFLGDLSRGTDNRSWWGLNEACLTGMLRRIGFRSVRVAGRYSGLVRRAWLPFDRKVFHATR
jgi:SAM-dependent methyltransferase